MPVPKANNPKAIYCLDTLQIQTGDGPSLVFLALDAFSGKIAHSEVHLSEEEGAYYSFVKTFAQEEGLKDSAITVIVSLDPGSEDLLKDAFPFIEDVVSDIQLCRQHTETAWEFIITALKEGNTQ